MPLGMPLGICLRRWVMPRIILQAGKTALKVISTLVFCFVIFWAVDSLTNQFNNWQAEVWQQTAKDYRENKQYYEAVQIYESIIRDYPQTDYELMARKDLATLSVEWGYIQLAEEITGTLITLFPDHSDLQETLYWITEMYERTDRFEDAKYKYLQIIQDYPDSPWADWATLAIARTDIKSLIVSEKFDEANEAFDKLIIDFAAHPNLPETLYWITERFERSGRFEDAKYKYLQIIENYPDSPWAERAGLCIAETDVMLLATIQNYTQAKEALVQLTAEFSGDPNLPEKIYWIAERFERADRFKDAETCYRQIIANHPDSPWADKANLAVSRTNVISLVADTEFEKANEALDRLIIDFAAHPDLPASIYWITEKYERYEQFDIAKQNYRKIVDNYPYSLYAGKSALGIYRVEIKSFIDTQNCDLAETYITKMLTDFATHPDLPQTLFWIADKYAWSANFQQAKNIYKQIIQDYPDNPFANRTPLWIAKTDIMSLIKNEEYALADESLQEFLTDFVSHPDMPHALREIGLAYYRKARLTKIETGDTEKEQELYRKAIAVWQQLILQCPDSEYAPVSCYSCGIRYTQDLQEYRLGIDYFQLLVDTWPDHQHACRAQLYVGAYYHLLLSSGAMPEEDLLSKVKEAYQKVIDNYPDCELADKALSRLEKLNSQ